jgi:hypothetical protein
MKKYGIRERIVGFYVLARAAFDYLRWPRAVEDELYRALTCRREARRTRA